MVSEDQIKAFQALSLGDFLKFKMPISQSGSFENSYVHDAQIIQSLGFGQKYTDIVLNDSRISISDVSILNFIYNLPLAQVRRIEYTPSMESFRYQTGALGGVLHIRTKQDS